MSRSQETHVYVHNEDKEKLKNLQKSLAGEPTLRETFRVALEEAVSE